MYITYNEFKQVEKITENGKVSQRNTRALMQISQHPDANISASYAIDTGNFTASIDVTIVKIHK